MKKTDSPRAIACRLYMRVEKGAYSNIALDSELKKCLLNRQDKAFAARLFYGTWERKLTLEAVLSSHISRPIEKLDSQVRAVLMTGAYQLMFMDSVPDSAAVNESVELIRVMKKASAAGMVNAVLRGIIRSGKAVPHIDGNVYEKMALEYSCPAPLIKRISEGYSEDACRSLLAHSLNPSPCFIRVNTLKISADDLKSSLESRGIIADSCPADKNALICSGLQNIDSDPDFIQGRYHVQDISSQLCAAALTAKKGDIVIDLCAAPGGKSFTIAQIMENNGRIFSCELHEKRTELIVRGAERLGIDIIRTVTGDARAYDPKLPNADCVLCDVPCSGYGVMSGKPEIRYKPLSDADKLPPIQLEILSNAANYVKKGGILVYSTCTVNIEENERVAEKFLASRPDFHGSVFPEKMGDFFKGKFMTAIFPKDFGGDGFFICRMEKT